LSYTPNLDARLLAEVEIQNETQLLCFLEKHVLPDDRIVFPVLHPFRMFPAALGYRIAISGAGCAFDLNDISFTVSSHFQFTYLFNDLRHHTGAYRMATFPNGKPQLLVHGNRRD